MAVAETTHLELLYEQDETAWLEAMADLAGAGRFAEMDLPNLREYLTDMANRDRREVFCRLVLLLTHLLKREHQPSGRGGSWRGTIREQRRELRELMARGTLRNHALTIFAEACSEARFQAADETELESAVFSLENPWSLEETLDTAI
jgi:hypothetical protein